MIAVVGLPAYGQGERGRGAAAGLVVEIAVAAAARGVRVELVGKVGDDGAGDVVVLDLGRHAVGHAALLRDAVHATPVLTIEPVPDGDDETTRRVVFPPSAEMRPALEGGDIELALRYLSDVRVIVLVAPLAGDAVAAAVGAAAYSGASLVGVETAEESMAGLPPEATVLEAPEEDDGAFGRLVGAYAAGLEGGLGPAEAFKQAVEPSGWEPLGQ